MEMDVRQLLTLALEALDRVEGTGKLTHDQVDRLAGINANPLLLLKQADKQGANVRLQMQAAVNQILAGQNQILAIFGNPEALAGVVPGPTLDAARQIKRKTTLALTGKDPAAKRRRDDEITLVSFPLLKAGGERRYLRLNKRLAKFLFLGLGLVGGIIAHRYGMPWFW